jgi:hypothetical protein
MPIELFRSELGSWSIPLQQNALGLATLLAAV